MENPATPVFTGRRPQSGQALAEFTVGLMALLLAVRALKTAIIVVFLAVTIVCALIANA